MRTCTLVPSFTKSDAPLVFLVNTCACPLECMVGAQWSLVKQGGARGLTGAAQE